MRRKRKSILMLFMVVVILSVGCTQKVEDPTMEAVEDGGKQSLSGEIVVATWAGDPFESAWKDKAAQFEEETGVKVVMDIIPWENLREKTVLEMASDTGEYDVLYVHPSWFREFADNGYLMPVEEYSSDDVLDSFVSKLLDAYRVDDVLYGLPDFIATQTLAYRRDLFEEKGIEGPESWDDILAAAAEFDGEDDISGITFPGKKTGALASTFSALLVGNGGWFYDDGGNPNIDTAEAVEVAEFLYELAQYAPSGHLNLHWDENATVASSGKAAMAIIMTVNGAWLEDEDKSATVGMWEYLPLKSNDGTPGGLVDSYCWSVANGTENIEAAAAFVEFIADTEAQVYFTEKSGTSGATKEYYNREELIDSVPMLGAMNETFINSKPTPSWSAWSSQQEVLETLLQEVMTGEIKAEEAMAKLQKEMEVE